MSIKGSFTLLTNFSQQQNCITKSPNSRTLNVISGNVSVLFVAFTVFTRNVRRVGTKIFCLPRMVFRDSKSILYMVIFHLARIALFDYFFSCIHEVTNIHVPTHCHCNRPSAFILNIFRQASVEPGSTLNAEFPKQR